MKNNKSTNAGVFLILTLFFFTAAKAQSGAIQFSNGITVAIKTETVPPSETDSLGNIYSYTTSSGNIVHRVMTDAKNKIYFGYDLVVEKLDETENFRVSIKPLSKSPNQLIGKNTNSVGDAPGYDNFTAKSLPKYPEPVILNEGETITLDILENLKTGVKKMDVIKVYLKPKKFFNYFSDREKAKDFTIDDVNLHLDAPEVLINGEKSKIGGSASGNIIYITLYGKGRFIFSFVPQPKYNFQKIGIVEDNKIMFDYNGESYRFINKSPVLGAGGKWNLWVMFDPDYKPTYQLSPSSPYEIGAADKIEYVFQKKFQ